MNIVSVLKDLGSPVAYYPGIARLIGVKETVFFCQLLYWTFRVKRYADDSEWTDEVFKSPDEFEDETGMSYHEQLTARKRLKELGLLSERVERLEHRTYYRLNVSVLTKLWNDGQSKRQKFEKKTDADHVSTGMAGAGVPETRELGFGCISKSTSESTLRVCDEPKEKEPKRPEELVYSVYPLKKGKPSALRAISKALKKVEFQTLLERTREFARIRGKDLEFCPHPATWFNDERYNDDPSTWYPRTKKQEDVQALKLRLDTHPANSQSIKHNPQCSPQQKAEFKSLKEQYKQAAGHSYSI